MATTTRERIVAAAVEMTTSSGWAAVTMARLADDTTMSSRSKRATASTSARVMVATSVSAHAYGGIV